MVKVMTLMFKNTQPVPERLTGLCVEQLKTPDERAATKLLYIRALSADNFRKLEGNDNGIDFAQPA